MLAPEVAIHVVSDSKTTALAQPRAMPALTLEPTPCLLGLWGTGGDYVKVTGAEGCAAGGTSGDRTRKQGLHTRPALQLSSELRAVLSVAPRCLIRPRRGFRRLREHRWGLGHTES